MRQQQENALQKRDRDLKDLPFIYQDRKITHTAFTQQRRLECRLLPYILRTI